MQQPQERQILVSFGNRHIVFGPAVSLPDRRQLGPKDVRQIYARVGDERDETERRIIDSLVVDGFVVEAASGSAFGDVEITDKDGGVALVEIRVGDRDFAGLNLSQVWAELAPAAEVGERREIWAFNRERLGLGIVWSEGRSAPRIEQLPALNVWEFNGDGTTFQREDVVKRLDDWSSRINVLFEDVETWAREDGLTTSRVRTVPMSEELMQKFAVPDRDLPVLDIAAGSKPVASLVPVGLWLIGLNGQVNLITNSITCKIGDRACFPAAPDWVLINPHEKTIKPWDRDELRSMLGLVSADE